MSRYMFSNNHVGLSFDYNDFPSIDHWKVAVISFAYNNGMSKEQSMPPIFDKVAVNNQLTYEESDELYWESDNAIRYINSLCEPPLSFEDDGSGYTIDDWT